MTEGLRELIARVQDAVQRLDVHQMEGTFDGQPFLYVLVRRAQVHTILQQELAALAEAGRQEGDINAAAHHVRVPNGLAVWVQWIEDDHVVGAHLVLPRDAVDLLPSAEDVRGILAVSPPETEPAWNVDTVEAEIQKPGYSIIRGWLAIHGGASARIVLEEICQLMNRAAHGSRAVPRGKETETK